MLRLLVSSAFAVLLFSHLSAPTAHGQARYQPATPTVSPYLNLLRNNVGGGLPNYYSLVRPQLQQQAFNRQQLATNVQQAANVNLLQSNLDRAITPTGKSAQFMTSGRATYLNTSRFYQGGQPAQVRARR